VEHRGGDQKAEVREGHFVSQDSASYFLHQRNTMCWFSAISRILFRSFSNKVLSSVFLFVWLLIEGGSKVQSTLCRCYRDTKVQDKVLPTTGRLF